MSCQVVATELQQQNRISAPRRPPHPHVDRPPRQGACLHQGPSARVAHQNSRQASPFAEHPHCWRTRCSATQKTTTVRRSIHAPVKGATGRRSSGNRGNLCFDPRAREGHDESRKGTLQPICSSIYAPMQGAIGRALDDRLVHVPGDNHGNPPVASAAPTKAPKLKKVRAPSE